MTPVLEPTIFNKNTTGNKLTSVLEALEKADREFPNYNYWNDVSDDLLQIVCQAYVNQNPQDGIDLLTDDRIDFPVMRKVPIGLIHTTFYTPWGHIRARVIQAGDDEPDDDISVGRQTRDGFTPVVYKTEIWACVKGRDENEDEYNRFEIKFQQANDRTMYDILSCMCQTLVDEADRAYRWLKRTCVDYLGSMANSNGELPEDVVDDMARDDWADAKRND